MTPVTLVNNLLEDDSDEIDFDELLANTPTISAQEAYWEALANGRTPETDAAAAQDPGWAYMYARSVLKCPFPAGEPVIASDPAWAYDYAVRVLRGPFTAGEPAIVSEPEIEAKYRNFLATL